MRELNGEAVPNERPGELEVEVRNKLLRERQRHLENSLGRYHTLYERGPIPHLTLDNDGRVSETNLAALRLFELERRELLGRRFVSFTDRANTELFLLHQDKARSSDGRMSCEIELRLDPGRIIPIRLNMIPSEAPDGRGTEWHCVILDLSELRQVEAQSTTLLETAGDAVVSVAADGRIESFNKAAESLFGYSESEVLGLNVRALLVHPKDEEDSGQAVPEYLSTGDLDPSVGTQQTFHGLRKDGSTFPFEIGVGEWWAKGTRKFTAVIRDVTSEQRAKSRLRESEARFRQIAEHTEDVFYVCESDGNFSYVNPAFEQVWGRSADALYANPEIWIDALHADDRGRVYRALEDLQRGDPFDEEYRVVRSEDDVRWVRDRAFVVDSENGDDQPRVIGVVQDTTAERETEEELRQAQKMEAVGALASGVAHDFNNVLQAILGCVNIARSDGMSSDRALEYLERAARTARRASHLAAQLMAFTRREDMRPEPVYIGPVISGAGQLLKHFLTEQIRLDIRTETEEDAVLADAMQIEQILMNLASNARDAMPNGGTLSIHTTTVAATEVTGRLHGLAPAERYVRIVVADTGCGIDPSTRKRVFEPFFTTKEIGRGTGLGLSTVFALTKRLGGGLEVESRDQQGTTFTLYFPICEQQPVEPPSPAPREETLEGAVLLVEDERLVRITVHHYLERMGLDVVSAAGPVEACAVCDTRNEPVDILVSDMIMPDMTGPELAKALRAQYPDLRVLFISANPDALTHDGPVLQKPFDQDELRQKVAELLAQPGHSLATLRRV